MALLKWTVSEYPAEIENAGETIYTKYIDYCLGHTEKDQFGNLVKSKDEHDGKVAVYDEDPLVAEALAIRIAAALNSSS